MAKGYRLSAETRRRMSEAHSGKKFSPQHKERLRQSKLRFWQYIKKLQREAQEETA